MPRLLAVLAAAFAVTAPAVAQEKNTDPEVNGKTMSAWIRDLQSEQNARLRRVAVASLGELAQAKRMDFAIVRGVATAVGKALRNDSAVSVRAQAVEVLGQGAEVVLEEKNNDPTSVAIDLAESLRVEKELDIKRKVASLLGRFRKFGKPGVAPLTECLKDADAGLRQAAADALGRIGDEARPAVNELLKLLADKEKGVRAATAFALGRVDADDVNKVAITIAPLLKSEPEVEVRVELATTLGLLNDRTAPTFAALAGGLTDKELEVRRRTAQALLRLQTAAKGIEAELKKAVVADADVRVRMDCLRVLVGAFGDDAKELIPFLSGRLDAVVEKEYEVRVAVAEELGGLGLNGVPALAALRKAQTDPQIKVREAAGKAIAAVTKAAAPPKK